jgi:hypothetical protein
LCAEAACLSNLSPRCNEAVICFAWTVVSDNLRLHYEIAGRSIELLSPFIFSTVKMWHTGAFLETRDGGEFARGVIERVIAFWGPADYC